MKLNKKFTYAIVLWDRYNLDDKDNPELYKYSFRFTTDKYYGKSLPMDIIKILTDDIIDLLHYEVVHNYLDLTTIEEINNSTNPGKTEWFPKEIIMGDEIPYNPIISSSTKSKR